MKHPDRAPQPLGAALSLAAGLTSVGLVASELGHSRAVLLLGFGLVLFLFGAVQARNGRGGVGWVLFALGIAVGLVAVSMGWSESGSGVERLEILPGIVGLLVLGGGVSGLRQGWERRLISIGTTGILLSLLTSGVVNDLSGPALLGATVSMVVAWDAGEHAVTLGEHLGTRATTWTAELTHLAGSVAVGAVAIGLALGGHRVGVEGISLSALFLLAIGTVMLVVALYN